MAAIDAQINAKVEAFMALIESTNARVQEELDAARTAEVEKKLAEHPDANSFERQKLMAAIQKLNRVGKRRTLAEHRRAEIIRMSLAGMRVREMAEELGLSYYYVVQVRRELGLTRPRKPR